MSFFVKDKKKSRVHSIVHRFRQLTKVKRLLRVLVRISSKCNDIHGTENIDHRHRFSASVNTRQCAGEAGRMSGNVNPLRRDENDG